MMKTPKASFATRKLTDSFALIIDLDRGRAVTNDAESVVTRLHTLKKGGLKQRKIYYRDSCDRFDEPSHEAGVFISIVPCSEAQQGFFIKLVQEYETL